MTRLQNETVTLTWATKKTARALCRAGKK